MTDRPATTRQPYQRLLDDHPARMLTYAQTAKLLAVTVRTVRRRVAQGRYLAYGEGPGKRVLYRSVLEDIRRGDDAQD